MSQTPAASPVRPPVLVVDDDTATRESLRALFEMENYVVSEAPDGVVALELLRQAPQPMVVLLDALLPGLDGLGVLQAVRRDRRLRRHAFILLSAKRLSFRLTVARLMQTMRVPYVSKPFDIDELLRVVVDVSRRLG